MAYPNCSKEQIKFNVINYSKPTDWIAQVNEEYLNSCVERFDNRNTTHDSQNQRYNNNNRYSDGQKGGRPKKETTGFKEEKTTGYENKKPNKKRPLLEETKTI